MKRSGILLGTLCVVLALALPACKAEGKDVVVTALEESVTIKDYDVATYDYTSLFSITESGTPVTVEPSYIDSTDVVAEPGDYQVTCTYKTVSESVGVTVVYGNYELTLSVEEISVKLGEVAEYDFNKYFTAKADGKKVAITEDMVTSTVKAELGDYTYTVTLGAESKTLTVHVVPDHTAEVVRSYMEYTIPEDELFSFDPTVLFSLYVDGEAVQVVESMVDASSLEGGKAGDICTVTFTFADAEKGLSLESSVSVKIVSAVETVVNAQNVVTYPNAEDIDLTSLFTITKGEESIPVTLDMIEGFVDYSKEGENTITLTYEGKEYTATVTVKLGVLIGYAKSDTVTVRQGTDASIYPFAQDFTVIINGARYLNIPDTCFTYKEEGSEEYQPISTLSFDEEGTYTVKIAIPYNDKKIGTSGVTFTDYDKEITYVVSAREYTMSVKADLVELAIGTKEYNPFNNIDLKVNGIPQGLSENPDYVGRLTTYAKLLTPLDFSSFEDQPVRIEVYVNGPDEDPVEVNFVVRIKSEIKVEAVNRVAFTGATLYTRDLFSITKNFEDIPVTDDMIEGKVDTFNAGVYTVTINYEGLKATARVIVYPADMVGTYKTTLHTIPVEEEDDDDEGLGGWGGSYDDMEYTEGEDYDAYGISTVAESSDGTTVLGDLVITKDGDITFNGRHAYAVEGVDENTMHIWTGAGGGSYDYTLHYDNGVVVLDINNAILLSFSENRRPLIYFKESEWKIEEQFVVNSSSEHVLQNNYSSGNFSLNAFRITARTGGEEMWYGLYIKLVSRMSSDTVYDVRWGEVEFTNFSHTVGANASLVFDGTIMNYSVTAYSTGKIVKGKDFPYSGKTFSGTVNGGRARLECLSNGYRLSLESGEVYELTNSFSMMKNGGVLPGDVLFLYGYDEGKEFSYKFNLNTAKSTFTLEKRDPYFGKYYQGNCFFFLDGYGTGEFCVKEDNKGTSSQIFRYTVQSGGVVSVEFIDPSPKYEYGTGVEFFMSNLHNVLTVKSAQTPLLTGSFENSIITDGAIVHIGATMVSGANGETQFWNGVSVTTKDGTFEGKDASSFVDVTAVNFSKEGFYQVVVKVDVEGKKVSSYYAVQVLGEPYKGNALLGTYTNGVFSNQLTVTFDSSGSVYIDFGTVRFTGIATIKEDNSFSVKAYGESGSFLGATGKLLASGLLEIHFSGAMNSADYLSSGNITVSKATSRYGALYKFTSSSWEPIYVYSETAGTMGEVVNVTEQSTEEGTTCTFTPEGEDEIKANVEWGNTEDGFVPVTE